jgi:hypothetical protein
LDALAALVVARDLAEGRARPLPDPPGSDDEGLPIVIWMPAPPADRPLAVSRIPARSGLEAER